MKSIQTTARLARAALILLCLTGCQDLEKLFSNSKETNSEKPGMAKPASPPAMVTAVKDSVETPASCFFSTANIIPKSIEVYAIDGQPWIEAFEKSRTTPEDFTTITINIDTPEPTALLLTAKQTALWKIRASKRTKLWGIYVTADKAQFVAGVSKPTILQQHYAELSDQCGFYWRPELQVHELYGFSKKLFGRPYIAIPKIENGLVEIKSFEPGHPETVAHNGTNLPEEKAIPVNAPASKEQTPTKPMTLNEALRANLIRPGSSADVERFKARYSAVNQKSVGKNFDSRIQSGSIYVITADFTYPEDLYGANSVVFIIENRAPYPTGNAGHSQVLDMNTGTCMGVTCSMLLDD